MNLLYYKIKNNALIQNLDFSKFAKNNINDFT